MRTFGAAFLGTVFAIVFVVGLVAFLAYRELKALEPGIKKRIDEKLDQKFGGADPSSVSEGGNYHPPGDVVPSPPDTAH